MAVFPEDPQLTGPGLTISHGLFSLVHERIPVRVEYIGGVVSRIVFQSCTGRNVVPGTRGHCRLVEFIHLSLIFGLEAPMNGRCIRLPLLYPEERPFAITKSPQIRMTVFALVRHEEFDIKRLQSRLIEDQRTFDIADSQNNVVEHCSPLQITTALTAFSPLVCSCPRPGRSGHLQSRHATRSFVKPKLYLQMRCFLGRRIQHNSSREVSLNN